MDEYDIVEQYDLYQAEIDSLKEEIERLKKEVEWHEEENHRLRDLLHDVSGALFCWEPVSEHGVKHKEELTAKLDAMFGEGK